MNCEPPSSWQTRAGYERRVWQVLLLAEPLAPARCCCLLFQRSPLWCLCPQRWDQNPGKKKHTQGPWLHPLTGTLAPLDPGSTPNRRTRGLFLCTCPSLCLEGFFILTHLPSLFTQQTLIHPSKSSLASVFSGSIPSGSPHSGAHSPSLLLCTTVTNHSHAHVPTGSSSLPGPRAGPTHTKPSPDRWAPTSLCPESTQGCP